MGVEWKSGKLHLPKRTRGCHIIRAEEQEPGALLAAVGGSRSMKLVLEAVIGNPDLKVFNGQSKEHCLIFKNLMILTENSSCELCYTI